MRAMAQEERTKESAVGNKVGETHDGWFLLSVLGIWVVAESNAVLQELLKW